ncbi:hypothetical protein [Larkinella soli]|uniref:hypothetical protein n=1 Tax=Larkinella soli TaxID=1770527 RepID=UPI000FFC85A0|nr:hypothetical protein [Larkinella soli]
MKRFLLLLLIGSHTAPAQTADSTAQVSIPPKSDFKSGMMAEIGVSVASTRIPAIRSYFRSNGIRPDSHIDPFLHFGFGGRYGRFKVMLLAGRSFSFIDLPPLRDDDAGSRPVARQVRANYGGGQIGFDLANTRNRRVYLNAGLGTIGYEYSVYRQSDEAVAFSDLPQYRPGGHIPSLILYNHFWDVNIEYSQREKRKRSVESVLRIGYRRGLQPGTWKSDAFRLTGAPTDRISQFYIQGTYYFSSNYIKGANR